MNKQKKQNAKKSIFADKKFKYGSSAVLFTVVVVALIIAANAIFSSLCYNLLWYTDMTSEQMYSISDTTRDLLSDLTEDDINVKIIFCSEPDKIESDYMQKLVHQMALLYQKEFDFVTVEYVDLLSDPTAVDQYMTTAATKIKTTNVIIATDTGFRVFANDGFFYFSEQDGSVFAFNGEYKITTAILQLAYDNPIAYFTVGHGETTTSSELAELFTDAGYDVRTIDLSKEEIDPKAKVIAINGPRYDFMGYRDEVNEIGKIADFLDGGGSLMVFMDPKAAGTQDFTELNEFLSEWGISFGKSVLKDSVNSISADGYSLVSQYTTEGLGASLTTSMRTLETVPKAIVRYAMPIEILYDEKIIDKSARAVSPVLVSYPTTESYPFTDESTADKSGIFNLMTVIQDSIIIDSETYTTYVLACGTTSFTSSDYLKSNAYGNADIIFSAMRAMGREKVPADIDFRVFEDETLDITQQQATTWTVILTALLPSVVLVCGIVMFVKRKNL